MKITYLILAHKDPKSLSRLICSLQHPGCEFLVHLDKLSPIEPFADTFIASPTANVTFMEKRYDTYWGSFGLVEATLEGFKEIQAKFPKTDRVVLLSGSDYPIKSVDYVIKYFQSNRNKIFIQYFPVPEKKLHNGGISRFPQYEVAKTMMDFYIGSQWFSVPFETLSDIFEFLQLNPNYTTYFRGAEIPDESFFQTLFLNCGLERIEKNIVNKPIHLIKWDPPYEHPRILTHNDFNSIIKSKCLFIRKTHPLASRRLLDRLDFLLLYSAKKVTSSEIKKLYMNFENKKKEAILLLATSFNGPENIHKELMNAYLNKNIFILMHSTIERKKPTRHFGSDMTRKIYDDSILTSLGYTPISPKLLTGSNHFPVLKFYLENPHYDYYWYIEDNVMYRGNWKSFFAYFDDTVEIDFLAAHVLDYNQSPEWHLWSSLKHPTQDVKTPDLVKSSNPIYRISNKALQFIHRKLLDGWFGHHEVLIPTLLKSNGFTIGDFGGNGKYVVDGYENRNYTHDLYINDIRLELGSLRDKPITEKKELISPLLYHPVNILIP